MKKKQFIESNQSIINKRDELILSISKIRKEQKLTQIELSELTSINQPSLVRIEKGKVLPSLETLLKILYPLGYTIKYEKMNKVDISFNKYNIKHYSIGISKNNIIEINNYKDNEIYDLASITKIFTLNIIYNLDKKGIISFSDEVIKYFDNRFLTGITIMDLIKMRGKLWTSKKPSLSKNKKEFVKLLQETTICELDTYEYTDMGFCILGLVIENVTNKSLKDNFEDLFKSLKLYNTKVLPDESYILYGNGNKDKLPHDMKTRIAGGITGAAGVFSNAVDLLNYGNKILNYEIFDKEFIKLILDYNFVDSSNRNRTIAGMYKYTKNYQTFVEKSFSNNSFGHHGFTGANFIIDFDNKLVNVILVAAIKDGKLDKEDNFFDGYYKLQTIVGEKNINM